MMTCLVASSPTGTFGGFYYARAAAQPIPPMTYNGVMENGRWNTCATIKRPIVLSGTPRGGNGQTAYRSRARALHLLETTQSPPYKAEMISDVFNGVR